MAEDIVQDIMLKIWQQPHLWQEGKAKFSTWLYRITMNAAIDVYRQKKKETDIDAVEEFEYEGRTPQEDLDRNSLVSQINQSISDLPNNQNMAIVLCRLEGRSHKEAAEIMGVSTKAIERLIARGVISLRSDFKHQGLDIEYLLGKQTK